MRATPTNDERAQASGAAPEQRIGFGSARFGGGPLLRIGREAKRYLIHSCLRTPCLRKRPEMLKNEL